MSNSLLKKHLTYTRPVASIGNNNNGNSTLSIKRRKTIEHKINSASIVDKYQRRDDDIDVSFMTKATEELDHAKKNMQKVIDDMKSKVERDRQKLKRPNAPKNSGNPKKSSKKIHNILKLYKKL